jgi:hypothetical protein
MEFEALLAIGSEQNGLEGFFQLKTIFFVDPLLNFSSAPQGEGQRTRHPNNKIGVAQA